MTFGQWCQVALLVVTSLTMSTFGEAVQLRWTFESRNLSSSIAYLGDQACPQHSSSCLQLSSHPQKTLEVHQHYLSLFHDDNDYHLKALFGTLVCSKIAEVLHNRHVVVFEELSPVRSSSASLWYWIDHCGLRTNSIYFTDLYEVTAVDMPFLSRQNDSCSIRGDAIEWLETLPSPPQEASNDEVWFLFPYVSSINATHRFLLGETVADDALRMHNAFLWNHLQSISCTFSHAHLPNSRSWHVGTIYDLIATGNKHEPALPGKHEHSRSDLTRAQEEELAALERYATMGVQSHMVSESLVYVYICVPSEQYALARWFVSYWKELYPLSYGQVFIRYRIIPLANENHHQQDSTADHENQINSDDRLSTSLSSRTCWREVSRLVFAETGEYDLVVLLRGLPALLSFVPPSAHEYSSLAACQRKDPQAVTPAAPSSFNPQHIGFIPHVDGSCGHQCYLCPLATIVLATTTVEADAATPPSSILMFSQIFRHFHHLLGYHLSYDDDEMGSTQPLEYNTSEATFAQGFHWTLTRINERFPTMVHVDQLQQNFATLIAHELLRDIRAILFTDSRTPQDTAAMVMKLCTAYGQRHPAMTQYCEVVYLYARPETAISTLLHDNYSSVSWQSSREHAIALMTLQRTEIDAFATRLIHYDAIPDILSVITAMRRVHSISMPSHLTVSTAEKQEILTKGVLAVYHHCSAVLPVLQSRTTRHSHHPWMHLFFTRQDVSIWPAFHAHLSPLALISNRDACPLNQHAEVLIEDTMLHFATGRWMWHTWTLIQLVRRVMEYDAMDAADGGSTAAGAAGAAAATMCTSEEMYTVLHHMAALFLERTRTNVKLFTNMTVEEATVSEALLVEFRRLLTEEYLETKKNAGNGRLREGLLLVLHGVTVHHAHVSYFAGLSVWRTQRLLAASLSYPPRRQPLLQHRDYSTQTSTMKRLDDEWRHRDQPLLRQQVAAAAATAATGATVEQYRPMLQVVTYGTEMNDGLDALLMSSIVSGVPLEIVGLNATWTNFSDLIAGIQEYLKTHHLSSSSSSSSGGDSSLSTVGLMDTGSEQDIVVVVDAYDILLLPSMRRLVVDTVTTAVTPVLISSEEYPYPEEILAWLYPHAREASPSTSTSSSGQSLGVNDPPRRHALLPTWNDIPRGRFLNSGIIVGPAKYLRHFFTNVLPAQATIFADDQHQWVRYYLETHHHPTHGLLSVDTTMHLAFSTYKHGRMSLDLLCMWPVLLCFYDEPVLIPAKMDDANVKGGHQQQQPPQQMEYRRYIDLVAIDPVTAERKLRALMRRPIYAIHGNNKGSNRLYDYYAEQIQSITQQYLTDPWRDDLLQLLWAWYDGDVVVVNRFLQQFEAIRSPTTHLDGTTQSNVAPLSTLAQEVIHTIRQCRDMFATPLV